MKEIKEMLKTVIRMAVNNSKGEYNMEKVDNAKVDKRKLIDEIGGILKGKVDDEIIRTIIGKAEAGLRIFAKTNSKKPSDANSQTTSRK